MAILHKVYLGLIFAGIFFAAIASARRFCIRNNSTEIRVEHKECEILATTFTTKEKEIFFRTLCKDFKDIKGEYSFFQIRDGILQDRQSYKQLCQEQRTPLMAWIPWQMVRENIAADLDKKEKNVYIAKATQKNQPKTELCAFRQAELVSNDTSKFSCIRMMFEDYTFDDKSDINVLVELLPVMHEIRNVTFEAWTNITHRYKTVLGKTTLKNPGNTETTVYGSIDYAFVEKLQLISANFTNANKLPLAFEHKDNVIELVNGEGRTEVREKSFFGRGLGPRSSIKVELIGQWSEHRREFRADIFENFGNGYIQYKQPLGLSKISFVTISNAEPAYENPELVDLSRINEGLERLTQGGLGQTVTSVNSKTDGTWNHPYPNFYPFFVAACVLVSLVFVLAIGKIVLIYLREGKLS